MLLCHLSEAVAATLSRGDSPKHGDSERIREQAPRRGYSAIQYFNRLLGSPVHIHLRADPGRGGLLAKSFGVPKPPLLLSRARHSIFFTAAYPPSPSPSVRRTECVPWRIGRRGDKLASNSWVFS